MTNPADLRLLTLTQWLSPAFPVGAFAYSHGLESAVAQGLVSDTASLSVWLEDVLEQGTGRMDALWIFAACRQDRPLDELDALARAWSPAAERLREAERQGAAFARTAASVWDLDLPPRLLPVALGAAARQMQMPPTAVAALYLHAFAGNLVSVAQRLLPIGQQAGQGVLARLAGVCARVAEDCREKGLDDLASQGFLSDIAAMRHETLTTRVFQS